MQHRLLGLILAEKHDALQQGITLEESERDELKRLRRKKQIITHGERNTKKASALPIYQALYQSACQVVSPIYSYLKIPYELDMHIYLLNAHAHLTKCIV